MSSWRHRATAALLPLLVGACDDHSPTGTVSRSAPFFGREWAVENCSPIPTASSRSHNAFPSLQRVADGTLVAVYRSGARHNSDDGVLMLQRSVDSGRSWSAPELVYDDPVYDTRDPHLTVTSGGRWFLNFFLYDRAVRQPTSVMALTSSDGGASWSGPIPVATGFTEWAASSDGVLEVGKDTLLLATYGRDLGDQRESARVARSVDGGLTWTPFALLARSSSTDFQEPALVRRPDGALLSVQRTTGSYLHAAFSRDRGATWSQPAPAFEGSGSPHLLLLSSGRTVVSYRALKPGRPVGLRLSGNGGETWGLETTLDPGGHVQSTYAQAVELHPDTLGIVYGSETNPLSVLHFCTVVSTRSPTAEPSTP